MKTSVATIDFGTSKIVTLVAENSGSQRCDIVAAGIAKYDGYLEEGWNNPEALDEAIYRGLRGCKRLRQPEYFSTWLTRILINSCHDIRRKNHRTVSLDEVPEQGEDFPDLALAQAMEKLPEKYRLPLTLCYSEHMTLAEAGKALGLPASTVQSRVRRGIARLRKEMDDCED